MPDYAELAKQWPAEWVGEGHDYWITVHPGLAGVSLVGRAELALILHYTPAAGRFLEIGTACGATAAPIAKARPEMRIVCVDNFSMAWPKSDSYVDWRTNRQPNMNLWYGTSGELLEFLRPGVEFDTVLADADHHYQETLGVLRDAQSVLKPGGTILVHDWGSGGWPEVAPATDEFCRECGFEIVDSFNLIAALKRS